MADNQSIFRNLAGQMPRQNQQLTQSLQESARMRSQEAIKQAAQSGAPMGIQQQRQLSQQSAAAQAQPIIQSAQKQAEQAQKIQQLSAQEQQQQNQQKLRERDLQITQAGRKIQGQLRAYNSKLSNIIYDDNLEFQRDELGRTVFNERQLADFAIVSAKSEIEYRQFEQNLRQASERKLKLLQVAQKRILEEMEQSFRQSEQELDQAQALKLAEMKRNIEEKIRREQARARNRASMFQAGGTILGAAIGAYGGAPGAMLGAQIGGGLGQIASTL